MSRTPEGRVKDKVMRLLGAAPAPVWYFAPVQTGYGKRALDFVCCIAGIFVGIETKAEGEQPTNFQKLTMIDMVNAGGKVFLISNKDGLWSLQQWLRNLPSEPWGSSL